MSSGTYVPGQQAPDLTSGREPIPADGPAAVQDGSTSTHTIREEAPTRAYLGSEAAPAEPASTAGRGDLTDPTHVQDDGEAGAFEHPEAQTLTGGYAQAAHAAAAAETPAAQSLLTGARPAPPSVQAATAWLPARTDASLLERVREAAVALDGQEAGGALGALAALRRTALEHAPRLGLPTRRSEAWKYTPIERLAERAWRVAGAQEATATPEAVDAALLPGVFDDPALADRLVLVNGRFDAAHSHVGALPDGAFVGALSTAPEALWPIVQQHLGSRTRLDTEVFSAVSTALSPDAAFVYLPEGAVLERPVAVVHLAAGADALVATRTLVVAEASAEGLVIERAANLDREAATFLLPLTEIVVAEGAHLRHARVQDAGSRCVEVSNTEAVQTGSSVFDTLTVGLSGATVRNNLRILPDAEHCESHLRGLFVADGAMHVDNATFVDHARPNCESNELYKSLLGGTSTGVFNGRILVRKDAQKTNAYQSSRAIVLSDGAQMNSKPELEIYADDVKCSHGAATGRLDDTAMFYLRQRGLTTAQARALLLLAFARDVTDTIALDPLRDWVDGRLQDLLHTEG